MTALLLLGLLACQNKDAVIVEETGDDTGATIQTADCDAPLECVSEVALSCAGPETVLSPVPSPSACPEHSVTDDAPDSFPVGTTTVTFTDADSGQSCTTDVVVTDPVAPVVRCPESLVLASGDGAAADVPAEQFEASDVCAPGEETTALSAETVDLGSSELSFTATDPSGNEAICTTPVSVLDLAAPTGLQVLGAALLEDGTTSVALGWTDPLGADTSHVVIQSADTADGPWDTVATASGPMVDSLVVAEGSQWMRAVAVGEGVDGGASEAIEVHAIEADGYHVEEVDLPGISFATSLYGVVRHPADLDAGPYPLVLLIHGNHGNCRSIGTSYDDCATIDTHSCDYPGYEPAPNAEGMAFQAETLAAQGFVAVSISANALNCRNVYIVERAWLLRGHLAQWLDWSEEVGGKYEGTVDLTNVGLVGHSRGGDAVGVAPGLLEANPLDGVDIGAIFAIAPTDYEDTTVGDTPYLTVLPACDGDVSSLSGREIYDRSSVTSDGAARAQALVLGANHNYFSTEWAYNDAYYDCQAGDLLSARAQQGWLEATEGAWFRAMLQGEALRGDAMAEANTPECVLDWAASDLDVRWSFSAAERTLIDDFLADGAPATNQLGEANTQDGFSLARVCFENQCGSDFDHMRRALDLVWDGKEPATASFGLGGLDASGASALSFRVVSAASGVNRDRDEHDFAIVVSDSAGTSVSLRLSELLGPLSHLYPADNQREILQTVRVPLARLVALEPGLDIGALGALELVFDDAALGELRITDVELAE